MAHRRSDSRRLPLWILAGVGAWLLLVPAGTALSVPAARLPAPFAPPPTSPSPPSIPVVKSVGPTLIFANVTWNGKSTSGATTIGSALSVDFAHTAVVSFNWSSRSSTGGPANLTIATARLQLIFFGFPASTRDVTVTNPAPATGARIDLTWDSTTYRYVLQGLFQLRASLLTPGGTSLWNESFYISARAPYDLTAFTVALVLIGVYEAYALATCGGRALEGRKPASSLPPKQAPPGPGGPT